MLMSILLAGVLPNLLTFALCAALFWVVYGFRRDSSRPD